MNEIWLHPYKLKYRNSTLFREGFLLKLADSAGAAGYADMSPWPQFGDPKAEEIPEYLKKEKSHPLINQSLAMAQLDREARLNSQRFLEEKAVNCHYTLTELTENSIAEVLSAFDQGFKKIKIKLGKDFALEFPLLLRLVKECHGEPWLRLDFNGRAQKEDLLTLTEISDAIEFIEDPYPEPGAWAESPLPLAFDQPGFPKDEVEPAWQILKPAKQKNTEAKASNIVFTSYLDHPVGMVHAMNQALQFGNQKTEYGFMSHLVFEPNEFSEALLVEGPQVQIQSGGSGVGFDHLLENLKWERLL